MWRCKLFGHKLIQGKDIIFCERCGLDKNMAQDENFIIPKGKTQFIESVTFEDKYKKAKEITDILEN